MKRILLYSLIAFLFLSTTARGLTVYSLRAGSFEKEADAEALVSQLSADFDPVFIRKAASDQGGRFEVFVGHIPYKIEAWILCRHLSQSVQLSFDTISWQWDGKEIERNWMNVDLPFDSNALASWLPRNGDCPLYYERRVGPPPAEVQTALDSPSLEGLTDQQLYDRGDWGD